MRTVSFPIPMILLLIATMSGVAPAADFELEHPMYNDPKIEFPPPIPYFSPALKPLWLKALNHTESDLQQQIAATIAKAYLLGMHELADSPDVIEALERRLGAENDLVIRRAAARTLVVLDCKSSAPLLYDRLDSDGLDMAQLVEPALANWDYEPARTMWLKRLKNERASRKQLVLAIRGLGKVKERKAAVRLRELATDNSMPTTVRLAAARALAEIQSTGLVEPSRTLGADTSPSKIADRLVAASLLGSHQSEESNDLLVQLALDPEPAVAAIAIGRLLAIDPLLVAPHSRTLAKSPDGKVRLLIARAFLAQATTGAVEQLGSLLDDQHPHVRNFARRALVELAENSQLRSTVIAQGVEALEADTWRGKEQAIILLVLLDHKPAAKQLIPLFDFERQEVFEAAAWGLRRLAVPDTLAAMYDKAERETRNSEEGVSNTRTSDHQVAQLMQAFGEMNYRPAVPLLRKYVPKSFVPMTMSPFGEQSRAAAIWSLGHLYAGKNDAKLNEEIAARLTDMSIVLPEYEEVRRMSAISLGRMNAIEKLADLARFQEMSGVDSFVGYSCAWAMNAITGKRIPQLKPGRLRWSTWILQPVEE